MASKKKSTDKKSNKKRKASSKSVSNTSKKTSKPKKSSGKEIDKLLVENFITLQRVLTNLSVRFDSLTEQISKLLSLFEISAKSLAQKQGSKISIEDKEFLSKLDRLMEQNKLIARGLTAIGERNQSPQPNIRPTHARP